MKLSFNNMLYAFSYALDCVEHEILGVTTNHGKRVAYLSILIGKYLELPEEQLIDLGACAILHDNALTEYIQEEYFNGVNLYEQKEIINAGTHCIIGEKNIKKIKLCNEAKGAILYHHENADGSGPLKKLAKDTPLFAQIIHMADQVDATWDLSDIHKQKYQNIIGFVENNKNIMFSEQCVEAFFNGIEYNQLKNMSNEKLDKTLNESVNDVEREYSEKEIKDLVGFFAQIIDYKSTFTKRHSLGIAEKAEFMTKHYGFDRPTAVKMYVAGALHDIGKLVVNNDILEKPSHLTNDEYKQIQNHAYYSYMILKNIKGFEEITNWASFHHEKLNGKGYPFGKKAEELGFNERLMACLDIYQALIEDRPYKKGMSHDEAINILGRMVASGGLDGKIVKEIDKVYGKCLAKTS